MTRPKSRAVDVDPDALYEILGSPLLAWVNLARSIERLTP